MNAINLVPSVILTGRLWRSRLEVAGITIGLTALCCGGFWLILQQQTGIAEQQANQSKNAATATVKQALSSADIADTLTRVTAFNTLAASEINWPQALTDVSGLVPKDVRLTSYSYALGPINLTLQIGGQAKTAAAFATFASTVQSDSRFASVSVDSYSYAPITGLVSFTMTILQLPARLTYHPAQ